MRVLFDQGTPVPLRNYLGEHEVATAAEMGWSTLSNGQLLDVADKHLPHAKGKLQRTVCFGSVLNSIDAHDLLWMVYPVKNTPVTDTQFAQAGEVIRHADQASMNHHTAFSANQMILRSTAEPMAGSRALSWLRLSGLLRFGRS